MLSVVMELRPFIQKHASICPSVILPNIVTLVKNDFNIEWAERFQSNQY